MKMKIILLLLLLVALYFLIMTFYHSPRKLIDTGDDNKILLHELNWLSTKQNERLKAIRYSLFNLIKLHI